MVFLELLDERKEQGLQVQIYATDLDDDAIAVARVGRYTRHLVEHMAPARLRRFFNKDDNADGSYTVRKELREKVVFAVQDVVKDPPFTKLDLLSCRNLMIYFEPELQKQLIPVFHYALKPDGLLFLSASESIANHPELFAAVDRKWKFYRAIHTAAATASTILAKRARAAKDSEWPAASAVIRQSKAISEVGVGELSQRVLLQNYAPASVTTDAKGNILFVHGDTGRYLRPAPGPASHNVIKMAREGLESPLRVAIRGAANTAVSTLNRQVLMKADGVLTKVSFSVRRLPGQHSAAGTETGENLLLVSFQDVAQSGTPAHKPTTKQGRSKGLGKESSPSAEAVRIRELEQALADSGESLQAAIAELQATSEEFKSTNEELQSTNEELQSSNEELETSREELQSLNEETFMVNSELNAKVEQLSGTQNDIKNLLDSINTATMFLDHHLVIRRYTPSVVALYRLISTDVGRPIGDITTHIEGIDLIPELQRVLDTLVPQEHEVHTVDGAWYLARIQPYRTVDNVIAGVLMTFTNVTDFKLNSIKLGVAEKAQVLAEGIVNTVAEPLVVLDSALKVVSASDSFYKHFQVQAVETVGRRIYDLGNGQWNIAALRQLLDNVLPAAQTIDGYIVEHNFPGIGPRRMVVNARRIVTAKGQTELVLLTMVEIVALESL